MFSYLPIGKGLLFVLMTQMICGFLLSIVFVQSHNGMEVYSTEKDFVTAQVVSTRDIAPGLWNDWFTGGSSVGCIACRVGCSAAPATALSSMHMSIHLVVTSALRYKDVTSLRLIQIRCGAGGLNYQIEHHLFPTLPRHNLGKVQQKVQALCEKHGLVYENCGMGVGTVRVLQRLAHVASHA